MKKLNLRNKNCKKLVLLTVLTVMFIVATVFALINLTDKKTVANADTLKEMGLLEEKPKNFKPQIKLTKYDWGECKLEQDEIVIEYPAKYRAQRLTSAGKWYICNGAGTYYLDAFDIPTINTVQLKKSDTADTYILLVERFQEEWVCYSFEIPAPQEVVDYVQSKAMYTENFVSSSIENDIEFFDFEVTYYSKYDSVTYYHLAASSWNEYSKEQLEELKFLTSDKETKTKLKYKTDKIAMLEAWNWESFQKEEIFQFIPKSVLLRPGISAFIGQEYGFIYSAVDNYKKYNLDLKKFVRLNGYDSNTKQPIYIPYKFDPENCNLYVKLLIFSIDRELVGREYKVTNKILFNTNSGSIQNKSDSPITYATLFYNKEPTRFIADPSISVSVDDKYGSNYSSERSIGISQARNNFTGYKGIKTNEYQKASEIYTSIISPNSLRKINKDNYSEVKFDKTTELINNILAQKDALIDYTLFVLKSTGLIAKYNPATAVLGILWDIGKMVYNIDKSYNVDFDTAYANNERNILTFPAPSKELTKDVVTSFGVNIYTDRYGQKMDLKGVLGFENGEVVPNIILGKLDHYAQSIFMLTDVNVPTVLTSSFNAAFAIDYSGRKNSDIKKFYIPERFNYSLKVTDLFDDKAEEHIAENSESEISYFNEREREVNFTVTETGWYDLNFSDFVPTAKIRVKKNKHTESLLNDDGNAAINAVFNSGMYYPVQVKAKGQAVLTLNSKIGKDRYELDLGNKDLSVRLYLKAGCDNVFRFKIDNIDTADYAMDFVGASFTADLQKHYEEIAPDGQSKVCDLNKQNAYYTLVTQNEGLYNFSAENAVFDLYDAGFSLLNESQNSTDLLLPKNEKYYVCVRNNGNGGKAKVKFQQVSGQADFSRGLCAEYAFGLKAAANTKIYRMHTDRSGIYSFDYETDAGYSFRIKDESFSEALFGAKKAYLAAGDYYLVFRSENAADGRVSINFTPKEITLENSVTVYDEVYYSFIPKQSGYYTFNLPDNHFAVELDGQAADGANRYALTAGQRYIVHITKKQSGVLNAAFNVIYTPEAVVTYNRNFNDGVAQFATDITGYYSFNGKNISLYNKYLELISDGDGESFTCSLQAGEKYFVFNRGAEDCVVALEGEKITANFEATVAAGNDRYLKFVAPENGYYKIEAFYAGADAFEVYAYENLSSRIAAVKTADGYMLEGGCLYYIKADLPTTDFIRVCNGNVTALTEIPEGTFAEVDLDSATAYAAGYKFIPQDSGNYTFIFNRSLKKNFSIEINGEKYEFENGSNILKITEALEKGGEYEITLNLLSEGNATLVFGVYRRTEDFGVYVGERLQNNSGAVNKIAIGENVYGFVNEQISVGDIRGRAAYTRVNYEVLNAPDAGGRAGVTVDANGYLTVSNKLPQWTAFAVEVNIGRIKYGEIILDGGVSKVINFLIYVDVQDIKIVDDNNNAVYNIDVAHKTTLNLTAKVFPNHAAQADKLTYSISAEDSKYVKLETSGYEAKVTGLYTTPNKTYVKIYANCGDEFTVVIMVRVYAEVISVSSRSDINKMAADKTKTAYELVINREISADINVPEWVTYLKIRKGSKSRLTDTGITVNSDKLTLVFDSVEITGTDDGLIMAGNYDLEVHFAGNVKLTGAGASNVLLTGASVINVNNLVVTKADNSLVELTGGRGRINPQDNMYYGNGSHGGVAIDAQGAVVIDTAENLKIAGGNGGDGMRGRDAEAVTNPNPAQASAKQNGVAGESAGNGGRGGHGGNGGAAISCRYLVISDSYDLVVSGGNAGSGADGGDGAGGGNGGKGGNSNTGNAGNGGAGGNGGHGGVGGNGGHGGAAVVIKNNGYVSLYASKPVFAAGNGGNAGDGGNGGHGGRGGDGGDDKTPIGKEGKGGRGGNGGNGGAAGIAGQPGEPVAVTQLGVNVAGKSGVGAFTGYKGLGGDGGKRGNEGAYDANVDKKAPYGDNGTGRERP